MYGAPILWRRVEGEVGEGWVREALVEPSEVDQGPPYHDRR